MTANPAGDQDRARLADLQRLKELIHPHSGAPIQQARPQMTPDDRAETLAIQLERLRSKLTGLPPGTRDT